MVKEETNTKITESDIQFIEKELTQTNKPLSFQEMTKKLAYKKTSSQMTQEVKKYDPYCQYEIGDLIYKEYDELLTTSSKGAEAFKGAVALKVVKKVPYESYNCEMLEVDYSGGGTFRKYIDYMKKTKTQVLLPSNLEGKAKKPEIMDKQEDPRLHEPPMTEKDLRHLQKNLRSALLKSDHFFSWNDHCQLVEKQVNIQEKKIKEIENYFLDTKRSARTTELVNKFLGKESSDELFELYCMSLNSLLDKKYKKDFLYVSPLDWGKWHLKNYVNSLTKNLPLSAPKAKVPTFEKVQKGETAQTQKFPLKIYLSWREILSGGVKIPKSLYKELSHSREYIFTDTEEGTDYSVYYYPSASIFLGLKDFYDRNNVSQGASLTLEKKGPTEFSFWLKKSKKKLSVAKISYDSKKDRFVDTGEEMFTFSTPNKIIHLEKETLTKLFSLYEERDKPGLHQLLILIFNNFALESNNFSLHYLRAYHLVDILKQTTQEDVEQTLLNSPEFSLSEKKKGIFSYQEKIKAKEEVKLEEAAEVLPEIIPEKAVEEAAPEAPPEEAPKEEIAPPTIEEKEEEVRVEAPFEPTKKEFEERPKKEEAPKREKPLKKRRDKGEVEKGPRAKRGAKRIIEEKIEIEESEQEALAAVKAKEKEAEEKRAEAKPKEKKEEFKPYVSEEPVFGVFAEKLKSALDKKKKK
jgi:hypothetical protein